ncbi:hypothetical protein T12_8599, partial [Trichinella patagoniensis]
LVKVSVQARRTWSSRASERSGWMFHFEEDRHDENRASTSIQLAHLTKKSSKHGSEDLRIRRRRRRRWKRA